MKKKTATPTGPKCTSTISGGMFGCQLTGEHETHSSAEPGRKGGQHARWSTLEDGRVHVVTFSGGKEMSEWHEDAPAAPPEIAAKERMRIAQRDAVYFGEEAMRSAVIVDDAADRDIDPCPLPSDFPEESEEDEPEPETCNAVALHDDEWVCAKQKGHDDPHQSELVPGGSQATWTTNADGSEDGKIRPINAKGKIMSRTAVGSGGWGRPPNKTPLEQPEAELVTTEPATPGFAQDPAPNPGDTRTTTRGSYERWCWGPVGGWGWRDYPAKGKGCSECGRKKADCLCKQMPKAEPEDVGHTCGYCGTSCDPDGVCPACASGRTPHLIKQHRAAGERQILGMRRHPAAALFPLLEGEALELFADRVHASGLRDPIVRVTVDGETFILDGSNRGVACEMRKVTPRFTDYEGPTDIDSLIAYSLDKNGDGRRHLDPSVRAMIAAESAKLGRGNPGDRESGRASGLVTQAEAGKRLGVSDRLVRRAVVVRDKGTPKVKQAVMKGKLSVEAAEKLTQLPIAKQDEIASKALAKTGQTKGGHVKQLVSQEKKRDIVRKINEDRVAPAPLGPFGVIVIDPPWPYENSDQHEGSRGHIDYPPMSIEALCRMRGDIDARAKDDCILGLWITNAFMHELGRVLEAWGFTHRTVITWDKILTGVGTWPRGQTEHLVIASRGEPVHTLSEITTLPALGARREHSRKPDKMYELLAKHCSGPMIDMFSREPRDGWATWGAEPKKFATEAA